MRHVGCFIQVLTLLTATGCGIWLASPPGVDPVVARITPAQGYIGGGTHLTLAGVGFSNAMSVTIGGLPCQSLIVNSDTSAVCLTTAHAPGTVDLEVSAPNQAISKLPAAFQFHSIAVVSDTNSSALYDYALDPTSGALSPLSPTPFDQGSDQAVMNMTFSKNNRFFYTAAVDSIAGYAIDPDSGALSAVPGSPHAIAAGSVFNSCFVHAGTYLICTGSAPGNDFLAVFSIDQTNGQLSAVPGTPLTSGQIGEGLASSVDGKYLYFSDLAGIEQVSVSPTGVQTNSAFSLGGAVVNSLSANANYLNAGGVASPNSFNVYTWKIDANSGGLSAVVGSPFSISQNQARGINVLNLLGTGNRVLVSSGGGLPPYFPDEQDLYLGDPATGQLNYTDSTPGGDSYQATIASRLVSAIYTTDLTSISALNVADDGTLSTASVITPADSPQWLGTDPTGRFLFSTGLAQSITTYLVSPTLSQTAYLTVGIPTQPGTITIAP